VIYTFWEQQKSIYLEKLCADQSGFSWVPYYLFYGIKKGGFLLPIVPCLLPEFYVKMAALSEVAGVTFGATQIIKTCKSQ
jgi:hypothetical protein